VSSGKYRRRAHEITINQTRVRETSNVYIKNVRLTIIFFRRMPSLICWISCRIILKLIEKQYEIMVLPIDNIWMRRIESCSKFFMKHSTKQRRLISPIRKSRKGQQIDPSGSINRWDDSVAKYFRHYVSLKFRCRYVPFLSDSSTHTSTY